jgi:hypothetical protein
MRAVGRRYGALFLSLFGGVWLLLAAYAFGRLNIPAVCLIAATLVIFVVLALRLKKRAEDAVHDVIREDAFSKDERRRNNRNFGIVNAVAWIAVF